MDKKFIDGCKETSTIRQAMYDYCEPEDWLSTYGPELCDQGIWVKGAYNKLPRKKPRASGWVIN